MRTTGTTGQTAKSGVTEAERIMSSHDFGQSDPGERVVTASGVGYEPKPADDRFGMTEGDKARYGLKEGFKHVLVRDSDGAIWQDADPGRIEEVLDQYPGSYVMTDENGRAMRKGRDLVGIAVPMALIEAREREHERLTKQFESEIDPDGKGSHPGHFDRNDRDAIERMKHENSERMRASGMVGDLSPTAGKDLLDAQAMYTTEQIEAEQARWRRGGRHVEMSDEQLAEIMTYREPRRQNSSGGTIHSIPNNVRPRNFAGAKKA